MCRAELLVKGRPKACHSRSPHEQFSMQIKRLALRPLPRSFGPLRKIELDQPGAGFLITCPPNLTSSKVGVWILWENTCNVRCRLQVCRASGML